MSTVTYRDHRVRRTWWFDCSHHAARTSGLERSQAALTDCSSLTRGTYRWLQHPATDAALPDHPRPTVGEFAGGWGHGKRSGSSGIVRTLRLTICRCRVNAPTNRV